MTKKVDTFLIRFSMVFYDLIIKNDAETVKRRWDFMIKKLLAL